MKILFVITRSDTIGGAHIHVADMAHWLCMQGHKAVVVVGGHGLYCDHLKEKKIPFINCKFLIRPINIPNDLFACKEIRNIIYQQNPDLISLHSEKAGFIGRIAKIGIKVPIIFTAHGWSFTNGVSKKRAALYKYLERLVAPLSEKIITVSEHDRKWALEAGICDKNKIIMIHNGMPDSTLISNPGSQIKPFRMTMIARLDEPKDHNTLFLALSKIKSDDWVLDLIGDGPNENHLRRQADSLGLNKKIHFLGLQKNVDALLSKSQLFILITKSEGFPRSILEAMRAGLPVIASNVGGISEAVGNGENGYLVPCMDISTLSSRIKYLMNNPEIRARFGVFGRNKFEHKFLFEHMAKKTFDVYNHLIDKRKLF